MVVWTGQRGPCLGGVGKGTEVFNTATAIWCEEVTGVRKRPVGIPRSLREALSIVSPCRRVVGGTRILRDGCRAAWTLQARAFIQKPYFLLERFPLARFEIIGVCQ